MIEHASSVCKTEDACLYNNSRPTGDSKKSTALYIPDDIRERWRLFKPEDYEMPNAEYIRQIYELQGRTTNAVESIKGWVVLFGVLKILGVISSLFL
jgi:hypothetical protein